MNAKLILFWMLLIVLLLLLVSGCSTPRVDTPKMRAPTELRQQCQKPDPLDETKPLLLGDLIQADVELATLHGECALRVRGWIEWEESVLGR